MSSGRWLRGWCRDRREMPEYWSWKQKGRQREFHPCGGLLSVFFYLHGEIVRTEY